MHKAFATATIALILGSAAVTASAHDDDKDESPRAKAVEYRQAAMTLIGGNFKPMGAMVKGEIPFDAAAFKARAEDLAAVSHIDILRAFIPDSDGGDSKAKAEIWFDWDDFKDKFAHMQKETAALAKVAGGGDRDAIKAQFTETAKACKSCHKKYKD